MSSSRSVTAGVKRRTRKFASRKITAMSVLLSRFAMSLVVASSWAIFACSCALTVDELFIDRLQLFLAGLELFVGALQLLVDRGGFFVRGLELFVGGFVGFGRALQLRAAAGGVLRRAAISLAARLAHDDRGIQRRRSRSTGLRSSRDSSQAPCWR